MKAVRESPAISAARPCDTTPNSYYLTAAARRISLAKPSGSFRRADNAPSGNSIVIRTSARPPPIFSILPGTRPMLTRH